ncbi:DMT family protein [Gephyromycinifex aptenodytis]|uniref:hypothetical protein n=1 Tax=Gephyromycinifex aptenodytis TaxID=2716227 RepID=UPI00144514B2|nr:hypothetical protein [Gephyromycinifex aptenodytis]
MDTSLMGIAAAAVGAVCFAAAAVRQHDAVNCTADAEGVPAVNLRDLARDPAWFAGAALLLFGGLIQIVGLSLAPVVLVQPVGVLAVPLAVVLAARRHARAIEPRVLAAALLTVLAVVAFVRIAAQHSFPAPSLDVTRTLLVGSGFALLIIGIVAAADTGPQRWSSVAWAGAAGLSFGVSSALLRGILVLAPAAVGWGWLPVVTFGGLVAVGFALGAVLVQRAYAGGSPEVVLATLTVNDPLAAVLFGLSALGEGGAWGAATWAALTVSAVIAAFGVSLLARHHPQAPHAPQDLSSPLDPLCAPSVGASPCELPEPALASLTQRDRLREPEFSA